MNAPLIIANGRVLDPASGRDETGSVLVEDGIITDIVAGAPAGRPENARMIDAKGLLVIPGLIDMRTFTGEPGHEYRETLASAAEAAAAGGVTSFVSMPDTFPVLDDAALIDYLRRRADATAKVRILPAAAITKGLRGEEMTEFGLLAEAGAIALSEGRHSIANTALLRTAFEYAASVGLPVMHLPRDPGLAGTGVMTEGPFASMLGLEGMPIEAETIPLERDLQLAQLTGVQYHAAQISTGQSARIMARHKSDNTRITAGVSINNLILNENDIGSYRTFFKLSPPLRAEQDRQAMIEALKDGSIDTIHSDHDPQDSEVKRRPFADAAAGAIGLETMLSAALRLFHSGDLPLVTLIGAMTERPARILGLETGRLQKGAPADIALIDLDYPFVVRENALHSRSRNTAFEGAHLSGKVVRTWVAGQDVFQAQQED